MNLKTIAVVATLACAVAPVSALAQSTFFSEVLEVRVTNVDVIVTGRDGKPVPGLEQEDFEIYEDGVKKEITNFLEIREDSAPPLTTSATPTAAAAASEGPKEPEDIRRRQLVIFFDNAAIQPFHRNAVLPVLDGFVKKNVRKGDEVALITWANSLKAELEPTSDFAAVEAGIKRLSQQATQGMNLGSDLKMFRDQIMFIIRSYKSAGMTPPWSEAIGAARNYAALAQQSTRQRVEALKIVAASMRGSSGRKVLVFVTEGLSTNPAEPAFAFLDSVKDEFGGVDVPAMMHARDFELTGVIREVADAANSSGVTIYPIDVGGKWSGTDFADASEDRIITNTMIPITQTASITVGGIASETGGVALYGSTNWQMAFDTIANDLSTYYSLGYRSSGESKDKDKLKNVVVKLKSKQRYTVRSRRAVIEPSASAEMNDAVAAHLFRGIGDNDLGIRAVAGTKTPGADETVTVPLTITIPMDKLTLIPDGADLTGAFSVFAAFLRKDGAVSKVARQPQNFRFPADSLKRRKELTIKIDVKTDPRTDGISVGVLDEASRATGFAAVKLME